MTSAETDPLVLFWLGVIDAAELVRRLRARPPAMEDRGMTPEEMLAVYQQAVRREAERTGWCLFCERQDGHAVDCPLVKLPADGEDGLSLL